MVGNCGTASLMALTGALALPVCQIESAGATSLNEHGLERNSPQVREIRKWLRVGDESANEISIITMGISPSLMPLPRHLQLSSRTPECYA